MRKLPIIMLLGAAFMGISACTPFMYKPNMTQGNFFTQSQVDQIQVGMSRDQVHLILGSPSINDPFHPNIENYIFIFRSGESNRTYSQNLDITYANDQVIGKTITPVKIK